MSFNNDFEKDKIDLSEISDNTLLSWFQLAQKQYYSFDNSFNYTREPEEEVFFPYHNHPSKSLEYTTFAIIKEEMKKRDIHFLRKWERKIIRKIKSQKRISSNQAIKIFLELKKKIYLEIKNSIDNLNHNINVLVRNKLISMF